MLMGDADRILEEVDGSDGIGIEDVDNFLSEIDDKLNLDEMSEISEVKKHGSRLGLAAKNIEKELDRLFEKRESLKEELERASGSLKKDVEKESNLKKELARLSGEEAKLDGKRKKARLKLDEINHRILRLSDIKSEISEV